MNKRQRTFFYPRVLNKQNGEFCAGCGVGVKGGFSTSQLFIDHIDNDNSNNRLENLQLLCRACNRIKNPSKTYVPQAIKTQSERTNLRCEDAWRSWTMDKVLSHSGFPVDEIISSGAELFKCSPETIERRYLKKITSEAGLFKVIDNILVLKSMELTQSEIEAKLNCRV